MTLIEFECRSHRFALPLACVRRVVQSAKPALLPGAPQVVLGILNVSGEIVTVVDFQQRIGLPPSRINTSQRLLMIDVTGFLVGFIVDEVLGVTSRELVHTDCVPDKFAGADFVDAIVRLEDGLCVIVDPEKFLLDEERTLLGAALEKIDHEHH